MFNCNLLFNTVCLFAILSFNDVFAKEFDWAEIAKTALAQNAELKSQEELIHAKRAAVKESYSGFMPKLNFVAEKSDANTSVLGTNTRKKLDEYGFESSLSLFNGFATVADITKKKALRKLQEAEKDLKSVNIRHKLRSAYYSAYSAQKKLELSEKNLKRQSDNLKLIELKYKSGREALWSLKKAKSDVAKSEYNVLDAKFNYDQATTQMKRLMSITSSKTVKFIFSDKEILDTNFERIVNLDKVSPRVKSLDEQIQSAKQNLRIVQSEFLPTIIGSYSYKRQNNDLSPETVSVSSYGFSISFNIFNGLSSKRKVQAANAELNSFRLKKDFTERKDKEQRDIAYKRFKLKSARIAVVDDAHKAALARVDTVTKHYKLGLKTFLDWENAQTKLSESERDKLNALQEALIAKADMERAFGMKLEDI